MNNRRISLLFLVLLVFGVIVYRNLFIDNAKQQVPFSEFLSLVESSQVTVANLQGEKIHFESSTYPQATTVVPSFYPNLTDQLYKNGVKFRVLEDASNGLLFNIFIQWLPMVILIGVWLFFMRQMQGGGKLMSFGRIKPRLKPETGVPITFKDVAGIDEAKQELEEVVAFLKNPQKFQSLGGRVPQGILLCGQPGTGKTLLARAIAGEAKVSFFNISGSDFVEMFVGVGASRVRDIFEQARENAPCIIFIDEIDAVGRSRGSGLGGGNDEREQTLNQLLVEMDGFKFNVGIIVLAATNRPDTLDPALTRPGRFDRTVFVPLPDKNGRLKILQIHSKKIKLHEQVDLDEIAAGTPGFTGAELENLVNEAALMAGRKAKDHVYLDDFNAAREKILLGSERRSLTLSEKERETTAYHEAGHALVAALSSQMDTLHKVTIVPRGQALGVTSFLPKDEKKLLTRSKINSMLEMMMGGRAAEELIYNHFTSGASNDLQRATEYAHRMVCHWGMSDVIGPQYLSSNSQDVFLGRDMVRRKKMSEESANIVDQEVSKIVNDAYQSAMNKVKSHLATLHDIAKLLLKEETLDGKQILELINGTAA